MERVVVTGLGAVSAIGIGREDFWNNLLLGKSGLSEITSFETQGLRNRIAAEIRGFSSSDYVVSDTLRNCGKASQYATVAANMALQDSGKRLYDNGDSVFEADVVVGTTMGEIQALENADAEWVQRGEDGVLARLASQYPSNNIAINVSRELNITGHSIVIPTACAAGNYAIGHGYDLIKSGRSSKVLAGGAESFSRIAYTGFSRMLAMAETRCSPFDKNRRGMILGEGAGFLVLESLTNAQQRNAHIYAEVLGYGLSCDATHMTIPDRDGIVKAITKAVRESGISLEEVDYICAHGTGTPANDEAECAAIMRIFGERAKNIPTSSIKSMIGHSMGAASALEAIACCMAVHDDKIPPTINFTDRDDKCNIDCVPNEYRQKRVGVALNNSFAFGGNNSCVAFGKMKNL